MISCSVSRQFEQKIIQVNRLLQLNKDWEMSGNGREMRCMFTQ